MTEKNRGKANEKELFHGSRKTDPAEIYDSEEGFDMRFSRDGLWGQGNYFAEDANYSDIYSYECTSGARQLFLARVLTGASADIPADSNLRMPPRKGRITVRHGDRGYKAIESLYVYVTYNNDKAYPLYLITYDRRRPLSLFWP